MFCDNCVGKCGTEEKMVPLNYLGDSYSPQTSTVYFKGVCGELMFCPRCGAVKVEFKFKE